MQTIDKAILRTLIYHDIFDYPLKGWEIQKWLIKQKALLNEVEKSLNRLLGKSLISQKKEYFVLSGRDKIVKLRLEKEKVAKSFLRKAYWVSQILKIIPWIKLVGISGGLSRDNVKESDDIDLFLITSKSRIWVCRVLTLFLLELLGNRRKHNDSGRRAASKVCINLLLEEDRLDQNNNNIYIAYEILQMKVLWQRGGIYSKFLSDNDWVLECLPNWVSQEKVEGKKVKEDKEKIKNSKKIVDLLENLAKIFQLKIMKKPKGAERVEDGRLYFHPVNYEEKVLREFKEKCQQIIN